MTNLQYSYEFKHSSQDKWVRSLLHHDLEFVLTSMASFLMLCAKQDSYPMVRLVRLK